MSAVVTGGAQGIGFAIAHALAGEGHRVALFGTRDPVAGQERASRLGPEHVYVQCDVSREDRVAPAMAEVEDRLGAIAVLVNTPATPQAAPQAQGAAP